MAEAMGHLEEGLLSQLHFSVQQQIVEHLRGCSRDLRNLSCTCKEMRELVTVLVDEVIVPSSATPALLMGFDARKAFTCARRIKLRGEYQLKSSDIHEFVSQRVTTYSPQFTELTMEDVALLGSPVHVNILAQLPTLWPCLTRVELFHTALTCPLECTSPVALDQLLRNLFAFQEASLPHISVLRMLVEKHEQKLQSNLLVTSKVLGAMSHLPNLTHLTLVSRYLHLHDLALASLGGCTSLQSLTLELPVEWPRVTAHGLLALPQSLQSLTLRTRTPVTTWTALAQLSSTHANLACHLRIICEGGGEVRRVRGLRGLTQGFHGNARVRLGGIGRRGQILTPGQAAGAGSGTGEEHAAAAEPGTFLGGEVPGFELLSPLPPEELPREGLPVLGALRSLQMVSGAEEAPEPEDPDEEVPPNPVEVREAALLDAMLMQAPGLDCLDVQNAGPLLTAVVTQHAPLVPAMKLCVSCHSRVNSAQLLRARPQASLHLNLRGTTTDQLRMLVDCASAVAASQPGAGDFIAASSSGARAVGSNVTSDHSAGPHRAIKQQGCLVALDLQRSQEVTDEVVTELLQVLPSLTSVTLSSCRHVTADLVVMVARLLRPVRLRVVSCRLVSAAGWTAVVQASRDVVGSQLVDVKVATTNDPGNEVAFV